MAEHADTQAPTALPTAEEPTADIPRLPAHDPLKGSPVSEDQRSANAAIARRLR